MSRGESLTDTEWLAHAETSAVSMADGYARIAGRPGICFAQSVAAADLAPRYDGREIRCHQAGEQR